MSYSYGAAGQHIVEQVFHTVELQPANLITVYGPSGGTPGTRPAVIAAQVFDPTDAHLLGVVAHDHSDLQLDSTSHESLTASALLRKAQLSSPLHTLIAPPQVAQWLGDVVQLTDPLTGILYTGRVQSLTLHFDRDKGTWQHTIALSGV